MKQVVVVDHHSASGAIPVLSDGTTPRQYPVELTRAFASPPLGSLNQTRMWSLLEDNIGLKVRIASRSIAAADPDSTFFSTSEQIGLPLGIMNLRHRRRHVLLAHNLITPQKRRLQRFTKWLGLFDDIVVFSRHLGDYLVDDVGRSPNSVHVVPQCVDTAFFAPGCEPPAASSRKILAVGRERRDYATLFAALESLPGVEATVVANSPWAKGAGMQTGPDAGPLAIPDGVTVVPWASAADLRKLYVEAGVVVVPLQPNTQFGAGVNGIVESMSMGKATIISRTPGIEEYLYDDCVLAVDPGRPIQLADQIDRALDDHELRRRLGIAGRRRAIRAHTIEQFVSSMRRVVEPGPSESHR